MANDLRNWLEELSDKIPGYSGYAGRERRRDQDKLHREHIADRLRAMKAPLTDVVRDLSSGGRLTEVGPVDRLLKKLDQIENRVRFAAYGYAGFFDVVKIEDTHLESIHQYDLTLAEKAGELETLARGLKARAASADELKSAAAELESAVDRFNQQFDERHRAINDYDQDPSRGVFSS